MAQIGDEYLRCEEAVIAYCYFVQRGKMYVVANPAIASEFYHAFVEHFESAAMPRGKTGLEPQIALLADVKRECILSSLSIEAIANLQIVELVQLRIA